MCEYCEGERKVLMAYSNVDGMTKEEWLNREIVPTDFVALKKESRELMDALQDRMNGKAKNG